MEHYNKEYRGSRLVHLSKRGVHEDVIKRTPFSSHLHHFELKEACPERRAQLTPGALVFAQPKPNTLAHLSKQPQDIYLHEAATD
jgi:hypothetical protein